MPCQYPEHHATGRRGGLVVVAVVVAIVVWQKIRHTLAELVHWVVVVGLVAVVAAAVVLAIVLVIRHRGKTVENHHRFRFRPPRWLRQVPRSVWAAARWHHLTRNLDLARPDKHRQGKIRRPRAIVLPDAHGVVARVRTVPGSGRDEFDKCAEHISNYWKVARVSVSQPRPGRLVVRGMKRDPLLAPFGMQDVKADILHKPPRHLYLGVDEHGTDRYADLGNCPGICVGGQPGGGKSNLLSSWLVALAPCPDVQLVLLDGKNAQEYDELADRAWMSEGEDLQTAVGVLEEVHNLMTERLAVIRSTLGTKNMWHRGPSVEWPLVVTIIDECQAYFDIGMVKGDKEAEPLMRRAIFLASSLVRRGRSAGMLTVAATQKPTSDSLPSSLQANCPLSVCFPVKTVDAAAATLGSEIRRYESLSPAGLMLPDYTGVMVATVKSGQDIYSRIKSPVCPEDYAAEVAAASAHFRKVPVVALPALVPDDVSALVS